MFCLCTGRRSSGKGYVGKFYVLGVLGTSSCIHTTGCLQRGENVPSGEKEHISHLSDAKSTLRESDAEGWTMPLAEEAVEDIIPEPQVSILKGSG